MPLKSGKSKKAVSSNIRTEMHSYDRTGKIGSSNPKSRKKAQKQAVAIALSKSREKKANLYLEKVAAYLVMKMDKIDDKKRKRSVAAHGIGGAAVGGMLGAGVGSESTSHMRQGYFKNHEAFRKSVRGSNRITAAAGLAGAAAVGGLAAWGRNRQVKKYNKFVDTVDSANSTEKKANIYLEKIAAAIDACSSAEVDRGDKKVPVQYKDRPYSEKFFTRMKLRGT